jgi:hypothetical protein
MRSMTSRRAIGKRTGAAACAFAWTLVLACAARAQATPAPTDVAGSPDAGAANAVAQSESAPPSNPAPVQDAGPTGAVDAQPAPASTTEQDGGAAPSSHVPLTPTARQLKETAPYVDMPEQPASPGQPAPAPAAPKDRRATPGYLAGYREVPSLSLSPYAPQGYWGAPGVTPVFGSHAPDSGLRVDFHGYMQVPARMGIGSRPNAGPDQSSTTLHGDPVLPGSSFGWFDQTPTLPWPWAQVNFVVGNDVVQATAILGAWNFSESMTASTYFQNPAQVWFAQAFLTYTPKIQSPIGVKVVAGAYPERYGPMAQYNTGCIWQTAVCSTGAYPTPFIGYVRGIGTTATVTFPFEYDLDLTVEAGFKGDINHPPTDLAPSPSNNFASAAQGSSFAGHAHAALTYRQMTTLTLHYINSFEHDDRTDGFDDPSTTETNEALDTADGSLQVAGADLTVNGGRFGYLYLGGARVTARNVEHLNDMLQVLNTGSGKLLMQRYLGQEGHGNGGLTLFGTQYTVSLGTLLRYPTEFWGEGPDLIVSLFGLYASTNSDDPTFDGKQMFKYGTELTYNVLPWLAVSGRFDHVVPDTRDMQQSFLVFSPKLTFRSNWLGSWRGGTLSLQYAAYALGDHVVVNGDTRLMNNPSGRPDTQMLAIAATLGW